MKKKILLASALALVLICITTIDIVKGYTKQEMETVNSFSCYGYEPSNSDINYWKINEKVNEYGSLEQNLERRFLQQYVARVDDEGKFICVDSFGATTPFLPSRFKTSLAVGLAATTRTVDRLIVSSKTTYDGHVLITFDFGNATSTNVIPFHINQGASNDELVICKGVSPTSTAFTDCDWGYDFYQDSTSTARIKKHSPGESVIISNDKIWEARQFVAKEFTNIINGKTTFATTTNSLVKLFFGDNDGAYLWYNTTTDNMGFATSTSEFGFNTGGTTFTAVNPMTLSSGELKISTSTYDLVSDADNQLRVATSTISSGTASGTRFDDAFNQRLIATTTKNLLTIDIATTTTLVVGSNNPTGNHNTATLYIGGNATTTGTMDVGELCFSGGECISNPAIFVNGTATRSGDAAAGDQIIAHGLGRIPRKVDITGSKLVSGSSWSFSNGTYNGTTMSNMTNSQTGGTTVSSANIIVIQDNGATTFTAATISVDATNITLSWYKVGTPNSNGIGILWEAY